MGVGLYNRKGAMCMNISKFTQKSMQAVQACEKLAYEFGHQELAQEHLLYSLLKDREGIKSVGYKADSSRVG